MQLAFACLRYELYGILIPIYDLYLAVVPPYNSPHTNVVKI